MSLEPKIPYFSASVCKSVGGFGVELDLVDGIRVVIVPVG